MSDSFGKDTSSTVHPLFNESGKVQPLPVLTPEQYFRTLEYLVAYGVSVGKTKPVAAYYFDPRFFFDRKGEEEDWDGDESGKKKTQVIEEAKPCYIIFDLEMWPEKNEYGRQLGLKKIFEFVAERVYSEGKINDPSCEIPGVWTNSKINAFKEDYLRRTGKDDFTGKRSNIWEPNPDARRICATVKSGMTIPVRWGTYPMPENSVIAVRETDIVDLKNALLSVREGRSAIEGALYEQKDDGSLISRFDVYGMDPGFCQANYNPTPLKMTTLTTQKEFRNWLREKHMTLPFSPVVFDDPDCSGLQDQMSHKIA